MTLLTQYLAQNDCYRAGKRLTPQGIMVHSTGANNPNLSRYVPGNEVIGRSTAGNHWDRPGLNKCVHAFVGKLADGRVATVQTLPWTMRGWHAGGTANDSYIGFEICEDDLEDPDYFDAVYREAVELTVFLCREFDLDPLADGVILCHAEWPRRGIASNHGDVLHWFPKHGKNMDTFRADVVRMLEGEAQYRRFLAHMTRYRRELAAQSAGMPELLAQAKAMGLTDGSRPRDLVTREECAVMARAAANYQ